MKGKAVAAIRLNEFEFISKAALKDNPRLSFKRRSRKEEASSAGVRRIKARLT